MNLLKMSVVTISVVLLSVTGSSKLRAQDCGPRTAVTTALEEQFHERMEWAGLSNVGTLVELYLSETGTWTIIVSNADGTSCIVAAGEYWDRPRPPSTDV